MERRYEYVGELDPQLDPFSVGLGVLYETEQAQAEFDATIDPVRQANPELALRRPNIRDILLDSSYQNELYERLGTSTGDLALDAVLVHGHGLTTPEALQEDPLYQRYAERFAKIRESGGEPVVTMAKYDAADPERYKSIGYRPPADPHFVYETRYLLLPEQPTIRLGDHHNNFCINLATDGESLEGGLDISRGNLYWQTFHATRGTGTGNMETLPEVYVTPEQLKSFIDAGEYRFVDGVDHGEILIGWEEIMAKSGALYEEHGETVGDAFLLEMYKLHKLHTGSVVEPVLGSPHIEQALERNRPALTRRINELFGNGEDHIYIQDVKELWEEAMGLNMPDVEGVAALRAYMDQWEAERKSTV